MLFLHKLPLPIDTSDINIRRWVILFDNGDNNAKDVCIKVWRILEQELWGNFWSINTKIKEHSEKEFERVRIESTEEIDRLVSSDKPPILYCQNMLISEPILDILKSLKRPNPHKIFLDFDPSKFEALRDFAHQPPIDAVGLSSTVGRRTLSHLKNISL